MYLFQIFLSLIQVMFYLRELGYFFRLWNFSFSSCISTWSCTYSCMWTFVSNIFEESFHKLFHHICMISFLCLISIFEILVDNTLVFINFRRCFHSRVINTWFTSKKTTYVFSHIVQKTLNFVAKKY